MVRKTFRVLSSPKFGTGIMLVAAAHQLATAINALLREDDRLGFKFPDEE